MNKWMIGLICICFTTLLHADVPSYSRFTLSRLLSAEIALSRNQPQVALEHYLKATQDSGDPKIAATTTQLAVRTADISKAITPATLWAQKSPNDLEAQLTIIALQLRLGYISKSIPYLSQVTKISPEAADQHFIMLYRSLSEDTDKQAVLQALTLLDQQKPQQPYSAIALSDIYLQQQNYPKALSFSTKAIDLAPNMTNAVIIHGECLRQTSDFSTALVFLESHLEKTPKNPYIRYYMAELYFYNHDLGKAKGHFEILSADPNAPSEMLFQLTNLAMQQDWFDLAHQTLRQVEKKPDDTSTARYFLGRLAESQKSPETAIEWYTQVENGPFQVMAQIRAAILLEAQNKTEQALTLLESAVPETLGDFKRLSLARIHILLSIEDYTAALQAVDQGLKLIAEDTDFILARNVIHEKMDRDKDD